MSIVGNMFLPLDQVSGLWLIFLQHIKKTTHFLKSAIKKLMCVMLL